MLPVENPTRPPAALRTQSKSLPWCTGSHVVWLLPTLPPVFALSLHRALPCGHTTAFIPPGAMVRAVFTCCPLPGVLYPQPPSTPPSFTQLPSLCPPIFSVDEGPSLRLSGASRPVWAPVMGAAVFDFLLMTSSTAPFHPRRCDLATPIKTRGLTLSPPGFGQALVPGS